MCSAETGSSAESSLPTIASIAAAQITATSFFQTYRKSGIPVVITGLLNGQPDWNLNYLCQQLGDQQFPIRQYGTERYQLDKRQWQTMGSAVETHFMTFRDYIALLTSGTATDQDLYLGKCSLRQTALTINDQLAAIETHLGLKAPITDYNLWVGRTYDLLALRPIRRHLDPTVWGKARPVVSAPPTPKFVCVSNFDPSLVWVKTSCFL